MSYGSYGEKKKDYSESRSRRRPGANSTIRVSTGKQQRGHPANNVTPLFGFCNVLCPRRR
jgi:hypothetical protein